MELAPRYEGPPIISIDGAADDQLAPVSRQRRRLAATLAELTDEEWNAPSRCDAWTVQDVVAHLTSVNVFWNASVRAGLSGTPTRLLGGFDPATTPALMVAPLHDLPPAAVLDQFVAANETFLTTLADLDDAGWTTPAETPPGHIAIRLLASHALWDSWIHERDIALPLGLVPPIESDEVASSLRYVVALSSALAMATGGSPQLGRFALEATDPALHCVIDVGDCIAVHDGGANPADGPCLRGDAVTLLEALSLRTVLPPSTPSEWLALHEGLTTAFTAGLATT